MGRRPTLVHAFYSGFIPILIASKSNSTQPAASMATAEGEYDCVVSMAFLRRKVGGGALVSVRIVTTETPLEENPNGRRYC